MGWGAEWLSDEVRSRGPRSPGGWLALVSHREDISSEAMRKGGGADKSAARASGKQRECPPHSTVSR